MPPQHRDHRRRAGDSRSICPPAPAVPSATRLRTAADVLAVVEEQVGHVRASGEIGPVERARAVGFLLGIALRAIEAGDVAARVEALEAVLRDRGKGASA